MDVFGVGSFWFSLSLTVGLFWLVTSFNGGTW